MDRIENLIRGLDPVRAERESSDSPTEIIAFPADAGHHEPGSSINTESIDSGYVAGSGQENDENDAFSDDRPVVVPLQRRRRTVMILAGAAAAAVVAGAVVVGGSLGAESPLPAASTDPTPSAEPSREATADPSPSPEPTAEPSVEPSAVPTGPPADEGCRVEDVDRVMEQGSDFMSLTPFASDPSHYEVVGCTDEWMAMEVTEAGFEANPQDGGNAWYYIARRVDGQWLVESASYSTLTKWEFLPVTEGRTPQEMMDQQFIDVGIPVELRAELVGDGPESSQAGALQEMVQSDMALTFQLPADWSMMGAAVAPVKEVTVANADGNPVMTVTRTFESGIGGTCGGDPVPMTEIYSTPITLDLPSGATLDTKFVYRVMETAGGVYGSASLVLATDPSSGDYCMLYNVISTPEMGLFSMASAFVMNPASPSGLHNYADLAQAEAYVASPEFDKMLTVARSLEITG